VALGGWGNAPEICQQRNGWGLSPANRIMSDPSNNFVTVAKVGDIPEGEGRSFQVGQRLVALFLKNGEYFAIDDLCPHMGASLGGGYLDEEGTVTCPWHAWRFCVRDGKWADNPRLSVDTFEVRVVGDDIKVRSQ
jgi:nitrite reductase (NADH) small subunit/3-phenylpropionate/trans-cinnamate dioxygenase ferredoxin subunit